MVYAYVNYIGHRNILPQKYADFMMMKALENGVPETVLDMLKYHSELLYHPNSNVVLHFY
jgi:hypothetical protein